MKKVTKKRLFKGTAIALALTTLIGVSSNIKKDGRESDGLVNGKGNRPQPLRHR